MLKRFIDSLFSILLLLLLLPVLFFIGILIKIDSRGPMIFKQLRVGLNGALFTIYKFRTMYSSRMMSSDMFDAGNTSRVTRIGRFLRKWKLDELPQLFNVLKGDMSFVGPRPEVLKWTLLYQDQWAVVHRVRPGITDSAAILFRNEEDLLGASEDPEGLYKDVILPRKLAIYIDYVDNNSLMSDLFLILKTLKSL